MGAITNNSAKIFLSITDGKICRRVQSPTQSSLPRTLKDGRVVNEEWYDGWEGIIHDIQTRESDFGKEWQVTICDGNTTAILGFKYSSGYAASFLKALPNLDLSKSVKISPKLTVEGDKKRSVIFLNQNGPVKWAYTKENPNGMPGLKQIKVKGVSTWDDSDMMDFLEQMVAEKIRPNLTSTISNTDDLPF